MSGFRFAAPLWLLAVAVVVAAWLWRRRRAWRTETVVFGDTSLLASLPPTWRERLAPGVAMLAPVALVSVVVALARPQYGRTVEERESEGIAIAVALDTSGSMRAMDFDDGQQAIDRMEVVKRTFEDFVVGDGELLAGRPNDLIGLIAFGGFAEARVPLTLDHEALLTIARELRVPEEIVDARGQILNQEELQTAIGDALALAVDRVKDAPARSRTVILITDGANTAGVIEPHAAAELARSFGIRVYTIGVGTNGLAPFPQKDPYGRTVLVRRPVELDESLLEDLAQTTGGIYRNARDVQAMRQIYAEIDRLERTRLEGLVEVQYEERADLYLALALALLTAAETLRATRFRELP